MKYTIDTINKIITLEEAVSIRDFILELQANVQDWEDYTLSGIKINITNPIINYPTYYKYPYEVGDTCAPSVTIPTTPTVIYPVHYGTTNYTIGKLS